MVMRPYAHHVPEDDITDLHRRLDDARWPDDINDAAWSWGVPVAYLKELAHYWRHSFDWRHAERRINHYPQYLTEIDGLDLHFLHLPSPHQDATPLLLTHGWPGSIIEFLDIIPMLTEPELHGGTPQDAFHVIAPSLQGYGFSPAATAPGMSPRHIGRRHAKLMAALGYTGYIAQGGDWGSLISRHTAEADPQGCAGLHLNMLPPVPPKDVADPMSLVTPQEQIYFAKLRAYRGEGIGYFTQQTTHPQTLAYGLQDSPIGWLAWVTEKFHDWTDCRGEIRNAVSWDDLLANVSLYWFTNTIASSSRLYREYAQAEARGDEAFGRVKQPVAVAAFPHDIMSSPRGWAERMFNLVHWYAAPKGGHFAALETPSLLAEDLRRFKHILKE